MRYPVIVLALTMFAAGCAGTPPLEGDASLTARNEIVCKVIQLYTDFLYLIHKNVVTNDRRNGHQQTAISAGHIWKP